MVAKAPGQSDNTIHVETFPGKTVETKVANAMATCTSVAGTSPRIHVVDASFAGFLGGTFPALCGSCVLNYYRTVGKYGFVHL